MSRTKTAAQIAPDDRQWSGIINAEKCIAYLRGIGVEVDDATADGWLDTQAVHRLLRRMKAPALVVWRWSCQCGEMVGDSLSGERAPRRKRRGGKALRCDGCGTGFVMQSRWYEVARDGTETDFRRDPAERVVPFDWRELLHEHRNSEEAPDA